MALNPAITDWTGRTVWLVGASTGIGRATAAALHAQGAQVVVSARTAATLDDFVAAHPGSLAQPLDVCDAASVHQACAQIVARFGRIDLVLYCAGTYRPQRATAFDLNSALQHQQVNYVGALVLLDAVLPQLLKQADLGWGGHLSLVSSVAGFRGLPQGLAYGPTKAALTHLAETLYLDLHALGVGVSVVHPGFVATPLTAQNEFAMPGLMTPEAAATALLRGWRRGDFSICFPRGFTLVLRLLRCLPYRWYFWLVARQTGL
jgi:NAD(P)-dependent dehydrogenase (short-subunit alcohol dehydrogenase family)